ncbi:MAG: hypothetical protein CFH43_01232 [Proteobacteria bacterium]|nr:MAG: hypothetical protein CFH43_01232 [Pseudomonadota bacterium]
MNSKTKRLMRPKLLDNDTQFERDIFQDRIQRQNLIKHHYGLNAAPLTLPDEELLIRGFATVLNLCDHNMVINHPLLGLKLTINKTVGAKYGYLMSCGDYQAQMLSMIQSYIEKGDKVLEIGSGLGVTTSLIGLISQEEVTAVEPQMNLHNVIKENCNLNKTNVHILHTSITPEKNNHETDFHIMQDYLSSSLFQQSGQVDVSIKVPQTSLKGLIENLSSINTLVFDIMGAEIGLIYEPEIEHFKKIICCLNTPIIGEEKTAHIVNHLIHKGYELKNIRGLVFVFCKK